MARAFFRRLAPIVLSLVGACGAAAGEREPPRSYHDRFARARDVEASVVKSVVADPEHPGKRMVYLEAEIVDGDGRSVGFGQFEVRGHEIRIPYMNVDRRGGGFGKFLLAAVLLRYPRTTVIRANLADANATVLNQRLARGDSLEEAIRETPAYRIRRTFGFTRILEYSTHSLTVEFDPAPEPAAVACAETLRIEP